MQKNCRTDIQATIVGRSIEKMEIREDFVPLAKPIIGESEIKAVSEVLKSGWLTTGPKVKEFEENMQDYLGCSKAVGLTSCTGGLHIALAALGIGPGDEVIVPTYTFAACAHVVEWLGAKPVLIDVEKDTFNIDPEKIEALISSKTKAIMPVHFAGHACDMDRIMEIAKKNGLFVIEDAAHAIGTDYKGKKIGNYGDATVFSFYVTKTMTTAEGGMVVTNNKQLGDKLKRFSYFGVDKDAYGRYSDKGTWYYEIIEKGFKYNMDNIQGALGVEQLKKLEFFITKRRELAALYNRLLKDVTGIETPIEKDYTRHSYHLYPILLDVEKSKIDRATFIEKLRAYKVGTSVHFIPLHLHPYYQQRYNYQRGDFPNAEYIYNREVSLPLYPGMTEKDVIYVVDAIKEVLAEGMSVGFGLKESESSNEDKNKKNGKVIEIGNKKVGAGQPCFTIVDIGINFNGSIETAKKLIDAAVESGCDAVKFQAFTADNMYPKTAGELDWEDNEKKYSYSIHENVKKFELPYSWVPELKKYCEEKGIIFFSSICDEQAADIYEKEGVELFKTTSYAVTHLPLIEHIAKKNKPIIISTGGVGLEEVREAYNAARKYTDKIILLHCVIKYGASLNTVNMNVLDTLSKEFPDAIIGYSDHTYEVTDTPIAAVYKGAKVIEKHITLDRKMEGPDHFFALEPEMVKEMVGAIRDTEKRMENNETVEVNPIVLGSAKKKMQTNEEYLRKFTFRTIITSTDIKAGEVISTNNVKVLRPGKLEHGLEPKEIFKLIDGTFKARGDIKEGVVIRWEDVKEEKLNGVNKMIINDKEIGLGKSYIIAEIASAHCGSIEKLKNIVENSVKAGVDGVKFQIFDVDYFVSKFHPNYQNNKNNQFSKEQWEDVFKFTKQFDVDIWADVFDEGSADLADKYVDGFKLHSTDITNPFMIEHVAIKGKPIILATGGATLEQLKSAVEMIEGSGNKKIILTHGFQAFPTDISKVNLNRIEILKKEFPKYIIGYHDHTDAELAMKITLPVSAVAYGAKVIEKHVTDDRSLKGFDYESSLNPDELKEMIEAIRTFESSMGSEGFDMSKKEIEYRDYTKRYIVAKRDIKIGEVVQKEDLSFKRSTHGITPGQFEKIVGRKTIRDIRQDESITMADIENKVAICLAVRLKSSRLLKKAILGVQGQSFIEHQIDRIKRCRNGELILCTSNLEEDAPLIEIAQKKGIKWFAGSPDDVMDRFMKAAEREGANIIVRTTGDNPLQDPQLIDRQIELHIKEGADFTGIEELPIGFEAEVVSMWTMKNAYSRVKEIKDTEFMTWFIKDPKYFKVLILPVTEDLKRKYRVTLDTPEDQQVISAVFDALYPQNKAFGVKEVVEFLDNNIDTASINVDYEQIKRPPKLEVMKQKEFTHECVK